MDMDVVTDNMDMNGNGLSSASNYPPGSYDMGAVIEGEGTVNNLDFHRDGKFLAMTTTQGSVHLIDCMLGEEKKRLNCKSTGINQMKYSNHESCILVATEKKPFQVKYWSLYDNSYLRNFCGHTAAVTSLSVSPVNDVFFSASKDNTVRRWDLTSPQEIGRLQLQSNCEAPFVACDSSGVIFGVLVYDINRSRHSLRLYDLRSPDAPFQDICPDESAFSTVLSKEFPLMAEDLQTRARPSWTSFEFCRDGSQILINTDAEHMWLIDSYRNDTAPIVLAPRKNESSLALGCCFSGDAKSIFVGNEDNDILLFDRETAKVKAALTGHVAPVGCIAANPKFDMFATSCTNTVLWIPKEA
jgi:COMPASS component SWD2